MSATEKKTTGSPNRAIKYGLFVWLALLLGFFVVGGARAQTYTIDENFDTYESYIDLAGQGGWHSLEASDSCYITTLEALSEPNGLISASESAFCRNYRYFSTTTAGLWSFYFYNEGEPYVAYWEINSPENGFSGYINASNQVYLNLNTGDDRLLGTYEYERWNKVSIEFNLEEEWVKGKLNGGEWSATSSIDIEGVDYSLILIQPATEESERFIFDSSGFIDYATSTTNLCGFNENCQFCYASTTCASYDCHWDSESEFCWSITPPEYPQLEDCSGYSLLERLTCEMKNALYRIFIPSPQKIVELNDTLDAVKERFPYNYIVATRDFFIDTYNSVATSSISFSILGHAGIVDFSAWNATGNVAGSVQSLKGVVSGFFKFLVLLLMVIYFINFLKRMFK
jgi:hypothetical protein